MESKTKGLFVRFSGAVVVMFFEQEVRILTQNPGILLCGDDAAELLRSYF